MLLNLSQKQQIKKLNKNNIKVLFLMNKDSKTLIKMKKMFLLIEKSFRHFL
jgi:hypothetical protein